jgi:pyruvate/2-oxoglutarate dehydrogenase complex dihydrolipoamide acyltransferase (E2) component
LKEPIKPHCWESLIGVNKQHIRILPLSFYNFTCDAINNVVRAAGRGVQLQAADVFSLGISCIKLAAAAGSSPEAEDRLRAPYMLTLPYTLAEALQKQHASAAMTTAPAISSTSSSSSQRNDQRRAASPSANSSSGSGSRLLLAALIWARILCKLGQGFAIAGDVTAAAGQSSQPHAAADAAANAAAAEQQAVEDSEGGYTSSSWPAVLAVCDIGLCVLTEQLLPSLQLPGAPGCEEACSAAQQQLQQQCTQLRA